MVKRVRRSGGTVHSTVGLPYMAKAQENLNQRVPLCEIFCLPWEDKYCWYNT